MLSILKKNGVLAMVLVTLMLLTLFFSLRSNLNENYGNCSNAVCINTSTPEDISKILVENNYAKNDTDANFIAKTLCKRIEEKGPLGNLFDIRNNNYRATVQEVEDSKSETYKSLYRQMCDELEQLDSFFVHSNVNQSEITINPLFKAEIKISVWEKDTATNFLKRAIKLDRKPCANVYVRLNEHSIEHPEGITIASIKTDINGKGCFKGLNDSCSYSVLPISIGYKYGSAKGTVHSTLGNTDGKYSFEQNPITIPLLSQPVLRQIKEDSTLIVRTLSDFKSGLSSRFLGIVIFWWCFFIFSLLFKRPVDVYLISALLGLTGLCCLIMHALNNPLTDTLLGEDVTHGIMIGCAIVFVLQWLDLIPFYQNKYGIHFDWLRQFGAWLCKPFKKKMEPLAKKLKDSSTLVQFFCLVSIVIIYIPFRLLSIFPTKLEGKINRASKGIGYLIIALTITLLLFSSLGTEVGGMKVNLNLLGVKFQPSEIAKYLFVIFMAAFFCQNANKIIALDSVGKAKLFGRKMWNLLSLLLGFGALLVLYVILQDLGPAMVIIFTFIILYSIIKSKNKIDKNIKLKDIFSSDFAILFLGVITFLFAFYLGKIVDAPEVACLAWFVIWIGVGLLRVKQIHETSILFNLVLFTFIFGSSLKTVPDFNFLGLSIGEHISKIGERLDSRTAMCSNTWGKLVINSGQSVATANSQVADGLWGLATGGWDGQGLSNGECSFIPAFHTDMILESIGTQVGFVGLVFVLLLYFLLFRRALVVGYKSNHPFTFYLCVGIAIVTAVQLTIIALGSTGVIPLTGITVPLLSYGKVSMILNLFAFGLVLTVSSHNISAPPKGDGVKAYNNSMSLLTYSFLSVMVVIGATFFYYQWIDRNNTLIRPVLAKDAAGIVTLKYNPRISALVDKMRIGNIYDRNGVLLATSNKDELAKHDSVYAKCNLAFDFESELKRYYPFGNHLFFMVGDYNTKLFFSGINRGLLAEKEYLEILRGYDNKLKDQNGNPQYVNISSPNIYKSRFLDQRYSTDTIKTILRDYSALIPYLKSGISSGRIKDFNNGDESFLALGKKIEPADVHLSVDAILQTKLQNEIASFVTTNLRGRRKVRVSAVVLNATTGELLSSANYPLPNIENLQESSDNYNDASISEAYTDMDLGLFYSTQPGSTAKVMSALASIMKFPQKGTDFTYPISEREAPSKDAWKSEPRRYINDIKKVTMDEAIAYSSNIYFIKLVNEKDLYNQLDTIYSQVGVNINQIPSFYLDFHEPTGIWHSVYKNITYGATDFYNIVKNGIKSRKVGEQYRLSDPNLAFNLAWGQWPLTATPLAMSRVAAVVANNGILPNVKFIKCQNAEKQWALKSREIGKLKSFMQHEASAHTSQIIKDYNTGGKTGTAVRPDANGNNHIDAWYICFCDKKDGEKIAIALRIERAEKDSPIAKKMVRDVVLRTLDEMGYISKSKKS